MADEIDLEALLAAAARRLARLEYGKAAAALADAAVTYLRWYNERSQAEIHLVVGGDRYDALKDAAVSERHLEIDSNGDEIWVSSVIEQVFIDVLPPITTSVVVRISIRNDPVGPDWRELDPAGSLRPAAAAPLARLDPAAIPTDSDLILHVARLNRLDQAPEELIGAAKDLVEATGKLVLLRLGENVDKTEDVAAVSKRALSQLNLHPEVIAPTTKGAETMKRILAGLQQIAAGLAELRNMGYGTGHGQGTRVTGLGRRHAELAARAASAYVAFVLDTLAEPNAPWTKRRPQAKLVETRPSEQRSVPAFSPGVRVRHEKYGDGVVVGSKLTRSDEEVTVAFRDPQVGRKTLLASLAKLERQT